MSSEPVISVVMSVYNGENYLEQSVSSILKQTFSHFEFIICNDGSNDNTNNILVSLTDSRIKVISNESNLGLARSLNRCIRISRGAFIARQDADDISNPSRLQKQYDCLQAHPGIGVLASAVEWIDEFSIPFKTWPSGKSNPDIQEELLYTCPIIHGSVLFRRQSYDDAGGYNEAMKTGQDYDLWLKIAELWDIVCLSEILYSYRWHDQMVSLKRKDEQNSYAIDGLNQAVDRRLKYSRSYLGFSKDRLPEKWKEMDREFLSHRLIWWSAGARNISRSLALEFLLLSLAVDPLSRETRKYLAGIWKRKILPPHHNSSIF